MKTRFSVSLYGMFFSLLIAGCSEPEAPEIDLGEKVFTKACKVCHASGLNGAPIFGNTKMWGPRVEQGIPTLVEHAINGYGLMPAKGGQTQLSDAEVEAAVNYMVKKST